MNIPPSPERILEHAYGYWASAILAAAIRHDMFSKLEAGPATVDALAVRLGISSRSTQAMLDALLGMGLVSRSDGAYTNTVEASHYLVRDKLSYLGGYADMIQHTWRDWEQLPEVVAAGKPLHRHEQPSAENPFWENLVLALAPLAAEPARRAAITLRIEDHRAPSILDIAGGAGAFSAAWLAINPTAHATQLELPNVNTIAQRYVSRVGVLDRFHTIDGDMEQADLGVSQYDYVIYANIAHGLSEARNTQMFRKIRRALHSTGALVVVGLMPSDDRTGHPLLLRFNVNMILNTAEGATHLRSEYDAWLREAGFTRVDFEACHGVPFTIIYAR